MTVSTLTVTPMTYRGATLKRERAGHVNVFRADGGFVGGYTTETAARAAIDSMIWRNSATVEKVGPNSYRVTFPDESRMAA